MGLTPAINKISYSLLPDNEKDLKTCLKSKNFKNLRKKVELKTFTSKNGSIDGFDFYLSFLSTRSESCSIGFPIIYWQYLYWLLYRIIMKVFPDFIKLLFLILTNLAKLLST